MKKEKGNPQKMKRNSRTFFLSPPHYYNPIKVKNQLVSTTHAKSDPTPQSNQLKAYIFEIQRLSTEDGPGIRTTVFFKGCPLRCLWCHNPESIYPNKSIQWINARCIGCRTCVDVCPNNALTMTAKGLVIDRERCSSCGKCAEECPATAIKSFGEYKTLEDLVNEVASDKAFYDKSSGGVTVSGGEPGLQADFVREFFKRLKQMGISTALDTSGLVPRKQLEKILEYTDYVLYDIKEIDSEKHKQFTAHPNQLILENLKYIVGEFKKTGKKIWIRTPLIPGCTESIENIRGIGSFIVNELENYPEQWDLLAYNNLAKSKYERMNLEYPLKDAKLIPKQQMEYYLRIAQETGVKNVKWSGLTRLE